MGRPEADCAGRLAINILGSCLLNAKHYEDALSVQEAELAMKRRLGAPERSILVAQSNISLTYGALGRFQEALRIKRDVYSGRLKLLGEQHEQTLRAANNYASSLEDLKRFEEVKTLLRKSIPAARRVLGEGHRLTLKLRWNYAKALFKDPGATLDDLREAATMLEDVERTARRVLGGAYPLTMDIEKALRVSRAALRARETPSSVGPEV